MPTRITGNESVYILRASSLFCCCPNCFCSFSVFLDSRWALDANNSVIFLDMYARLAFGLLAALLASNGFAYNTTTATFTRTYHSSTTTFTRTELAIPTAIQTLDVEAEALIINFAPELTSVDPSVVYSHKHTPISRDCADDRQRLLNWLPMLSHSKANTWLRTHRRQLLQA